MKLIIPLAALVIPTLAGAQSMGSQPTMNMPNGNSYAAGLESYANQSASDTPTMRQKKLERAIELRDEANRLLIEDGGTLTPKHQAYVQRKARAILALGR